MHALLIISPPAAGCSANGASQVQLLSKQRTSELKKCVNGLLQGYLQVKEVGLGAAIAAYVR